jgi:hypothetical protein
MNETTDGEVIYLNIYSVFAFNALPRYSVFYLIINNLNSINCTLFNQKTLYIVFQKQKFWF